MKTSDIKIKARASGIEIGSKSKTDLVREIQLSEGNFPCFQTAHDYCDQTNCCWRGDCLKH